jgi:hypothetical protein
MRTISNAVNRAFDEIKRHIENSYNKDFDLDICIDETCKCYVLDFEFTKPYEVTLSMEYIDRYVEDKFDCEYDIDVLQAMFCWVVANNFRDKLEPFVEECKKKFLDEISD